MKKTIAVCNFLRLENEVYLPALWTQSKTYYEKTGTYVDQWNWAIPYYDIFSSEHEDKIKELLLDIKPDIFAVSLYVWNYHFSHCIAEWVKTQWPKCLVITGGPHQYFKYDTNWFKKHWYIDASLPGDSYGELSIKEILDNFNTRAIDWNKVTDIKYPKGKSRMIASSSKLSTRSTKNNFEFNFSGYSAQLKDLTKYVEYQQQHVPKARLVAMIETTRGCPYGCTYCDWGGGINTAVIKKDIEVVKQDVDAILHFKLHNLFICDANFGILGQRDVEIIKYIADKRIQTMSNFHVWYGGLAKTENKLNYIRKIVEIDIDNGLNHADEIKLSIQTLDDEILKNINRVSIPFDKQMEVFGSVSADKSIPMYVEIILGLPGMTLDKFYYELSIFSQYNLNIIWYQWMLLPETPAYDPMYQQKFELVVTDRRQGWHIEENGQSMYQVVVGSGSYTINDYLEMLLSTSMYNLLVQGRFYKNTIDWVVSNYSVPMGDLVRRIFYEFFKQTPFYQVAVEDWNSILSNSQSPCFFRVKNTKVYGSWYFIALAFTSHNEFTQKLINWLQDQYNIPYNIINADEEAAVHSGTAGKKKWKGLFVIDYKKAKDVDSIISLFQQYKNSVLVGNKKFLGII
jgi:putative methyltransferase